MIFADNGAASPGAIVGYILAALAAFTGIGILLYSRRGHLDALVNDKVEAKIGSRYIELNQIGDQIQKLRTEVAAERQEVQELMTQSRDANQEILQIRNYWQSVLPSKESFERGDELVLADVGVAARTGDTDGLIKLLHLLLDHSQDSDVLERAGDYAQNDLKNPALARKLYEKAVQQDRENFSALAELLALKAEVRSERDAALESLETLATAHPDEPNALSKLMDFLIEKELYDQMRLTCNRLLPIADEQHKPRVLRNLALARSALEEPRDEVVATYLEAVNAAERRYEAQSEASQKARALIQLKSVLRPYLLFVVTSGTSDDLDLAEHRILAILDRDPSDLAFYLLLAMVKRERGMLDQADQVYALAETVVTSNEQLATVKRERENLVLRRQLSAIVKPTTVAP